jgi:hypothetical protein
MQVNELWNEIMKLKSNTLHTLDRRKPFEIVAVTENTVTVLPHSTRKERPIPRAGIENAFRHLTVTGHLTLTDLEKEFTPRNPVYTAAILSEIPGINWFVKPIRLTWSG